jgi:hypothetical protein
MEEISNKTVAIILVAAIIISLGGTFLSMNKLSAQRNMEITGFAPGDKNQSVGNVSLTVSDITWLNFSQRKCYFGSGYLTGVACTLNTSATAAGGVNSSGCSTGFVGSWACTAPLDIKNIGNNNVTLNISWKNNSAFVDSVNGQLWFKMMNGSGAAQAGHGCLEGSAGQAMDKFNNQWQRVFTAYQHNLTCSRLYYGNSANSVSMWLKVKFTQAGTSRGYKQNIITAIGKAT